MNDAEQWMQEALRLAGEAAAMDEVPIGCVIVHEPSGRIIGRGLNRRERDRDATAHAEIIAIRQAGAERGDWRLVDCALVVTLEPCPMCAGAMVNARVSRLIYGCDDPKAGAVRTLYRLCEDGRLNHCMEVTGGVLAQECGRVLREFFEKKRAK
jgi:tRNA(adenine34) deaminase